MLNRARRPGPRDGVHARRTATVALLGICCVAGAQARTAPAQHDFERAGQPLRPAAADPQVTAALRQVSAQKIRANIGTLVNFHNRTTIGSTDTDTPPGTGVLAAADWIRTQFEGYSKACGGCLEVKVDAFVEEPPTGAAAARARIVKPTPLRNVYAILKGTDPAAARRMYLITGHYDTRETDVMNTHSFAPGANDDSSGTAVSLEAARVLSQYHFPATLVFVCVAGEEQGLNGSRHLARLAREQGWQLEGVLNNDIVGGDTTPGDTLQDKSRVRVFSQGLATNAPLAQLAQSIQLGLENDSPSRELARAVLAAGRTYTAAPRLPVAARPLKPVMELRLDRFLRGGDHSTFSAEGFPAVRFTEWRENYNHQHQHVRTENGIEYGDLLKFDDFSYIAQVARLNMATLATLAKSPGVPQDVFIATSNLDNNTTLKWNPPAAAGSAPVTYQVVWRETAAPDWQWFKAVPSADANSGQQITLPVSKDNVFFGVRACDGAGHCSQAVPPLPERPLRG